MNLSPFTWYTLMAVAAALYLLVAALDWGGHISERVAAASFLSVTVGIIALTVVTACWLATVPAVLAAAVFAWVLVPKKNEGAS